MDWLQTATVYIMWLVTTGTWLRWHLQVACDHLQLARGAVRLGDLLACCAAGWNQYEKIVVHHVAMWCFHLTCDAFILLGKYCTHAKR